VDEQRADGVRVEQGRKRVRAYVGGELVADTVRPLLVWERPYYPTYYFPAIDVRKELLDETGQTHHSPSRGDAQLLDVRGGRGTRREKAASRYDESPVAALVGTVRLEWDAMDAWFEEDEPVSVHPRNPYTRVDILNSSRRVRVEHDGLVLAESDQPRVLFETGLIPRWYVPLTDARLDRLRPSETVSHCPYKGEARHWSLERDDGGSTADVAWTYWSPLPECVKIRGLIAFYDEKVDLFVDGLQHERPDVPFVDSRVR
jgi:uncharacterized protein (DUF427 family)